MRHPAHIPRGLFWIACAFAFLLPRFAAAAPTRAIDFDGDGRWDQFVLDDREPSVLHVWLSKSGTTQVIHTRFTLLQVVAIDLDGDRRPELIARGSDSRIHVWRRKRTRFHAYRPRNAAPRSLAPRNNHRVGDHDSEPPDTITSTPFAPSALTPCASWHAPGLDPPTASVSRSARISRSLTTASPFAPRPPPAHVPL